MFPETVVEFRNLEEEGKTVVYKETNKDISNDGWSYWSLRDDKKVWRKIVTIEEAEQYELDNGLLN